MPRPKNTELKSRILHVAWGQFREKGYNETSYSSIAEECGISRNLTQYHFRKKEELAISFMDMLHDRCQQALGYTDDQLEGNYQRVYEVGVCYFEYLLQYGYRQFLLDIIESRDMTEGVVAFSEEWTHSRLVGYVSRKFERDAIKRTALVHMGGFYELLYYCLKHDLEFDVSSNLATVMRGFAVANGITQEKANHMFRSSKRARQAVSKIEL